MNQRTNSAPTPLSRFWIPSVLVQSASWLSVLSLLGSNLAFAQTATIDNVVATPTIQNLKTKAVAASRPQTDASTQLNQLRQKLNSTAPVRRQQPTVAVSTPPPGLSIPIRSVTQPTTKLPRLVPAQPNEIVRKTVTNSAKDYSGTYIDPTAYSIGATRAYQAPSSVVLKERSTGCKAVLRQGQRLSGGVCGVAPQQRVKVAFKRTRPQVASLARKRPGVAVAAISPVRVGPISISANGISASDANTKYNGKMHPVGKLSNAGSGILFPLSIPAQITSLFGWRIHPITGARRLHTGTDLGAPLGTPVLAAETGNVALADFWGGYGLTVVIDHSKFTRQTLYAHLSEAFVQPGEWVEQGTVIGRVGSTGNSTGPHLHFETRQLTPEGWVASDPGIQLESALAQLVKSLQTAKVAQQNKG